MTTQEKDQLVSQEGQTGRMRSQKTSAKRSIIATFGVLLIAAALALAYISTTSNSTILIENTLLQSDAGDENNCGANAANDDMYLDGSQLINPQFCTGTSPLPDRVALLVRSRLQLGGLPESQLPKVDELRSHWCDKLGAVDYDASGVCTNSQRDLLASQLTRFATATNFDVDCSKTVNNDFRPFLDFDAVPCFAAALRVLPENVASFATDFSFCLFKQHVSKNSYPTDTCPPCFINDNIRFAKRARYVADCNDPIVKALLPSADYGSFPLAKCVAEARQALESQDPQVAKFIARFYGCEFSRSFLDMEQH